MKMILKNAAILLLITAVAAVGLSFVYELTKEPIALAEQHAKAAAYQAVYADANSFDKIAAEASVLSDFNATLTGGTRVEEVLRTISADGTHLGYAVATVGKGYAGDVKIALGIDKDGKVVGYSVLSHGETPGFGANAENADVREQFIGITAADQLDGITDATYTTNALKNATQAAIDLVKEIEGDGV